jgi:hypothetical protein
MNWEGREADLALPSIAKVKTEWSCTSSSPYDFTAWCLIQHRDNFSFNFRVMKGEEVCVEATFSVCTGKRDVSEFRVKSATVSQDRPRSPPFRSLLLTIHDDLIISLHSIIIVVIGKTALF